MPMEDAAAAPSRREDLVFVPHSPGPLVEPGDTGREPDEIDEIVDELFGPDPTDGPGRADVVLLVLGAGLLLWSLLSAHSTLVTAIGVALVLLGLVLPVRNLWRRVHARRDDRKLSRLSRRGLALNAGTPETRELVAAYRDLLAVALPGTPLAPEALSAAHLALIESATLVGAEGPTTQEERGYVERRVSGIRDLVTELERHRDAAADVPEDDRRLDRRARTLAGAELDSTGDSSLRELDELRRALAADPGD